MGKILFNEPYQSGNELKYLTEVLNNQKFQGNGPFTKKAQNFIKTYTSAESVLLTHSCTGALELSALLLDIGPGDEVILPSYTFASTASAFLRNGAKLIFADINPNSLMIDKEDVVDKITDNTKAVVPISYAGLSPELKDIKKICNESEINMIEDNAQGLGSSSYGNSLGTHGILGTLSFHETKNIHCGLGGALLINDNSLFDRAENIWERGTNRSKMLKGLVDKYTWVDVGSSFYPSELQSAFLLAQLESIDENLEKRKILCMEYDVLLSDMENFGKIRRQTRDHTESWNYHAMVVIFESPKITNSVRNDLLSNDIHSYIGYVPLHSSPMGRSLNEEVISLPVTDLISENILRLPLHCNMSISDVRKVCKCIKESLSGVK